MRATLAFWLIAAFCSALAALFFYTVPSANSRLVDFMLGQLSVFTAGALAFYFNTSKSSSDKNKVLAEAMDGPHPPRHGVDTPEGEA